MGFVQLKIIGILSISSYECVWTTIYMHYFWLGTLIHTLHSHWGTGTIQQDNEPPYKCMPHYIYRRIHLFLEFYRSKHDPRSECDRIYLRWHATCFPTEKSKTLEYTRIVKRSEGSVGWIACSTFLLFFVFPQSLPPSVGLPSIKLVYIYLFFICQWGYV